VKLFVGGLPWSVDDHQLRGYFERCGQIVDAKVINDRATGNSRGFGFVTMMTEDDAQRAIDSLHQTVGRLNAASRVCSR